MSERLLDREIELGRLEAAWADARRGRPQLAVVWGRRRVGKTFLLSHFVRGKRSVFFVATQQAERIELGRLWEAVRRDLGEEVADLAGGTFTSWESAFRFFAALARTEPLAIVLDEVPYLARSTPGFASIVQAVWDHLPTRTHLLLALSGSAVGMVEAMLGAGGALRGRPTVAFRMDPFDPVRARGFLPRLEPAAFLEAYAACGGYPLHLRAWDPGASTEENLLSLAFTPGGILLEDAEGILSEELPDTGGYPRILAAIGRGRTKPSEIADDAGQRIEHPLAVLVRSGFVRRSVPVGAPKGSRAIYDIDDPYLAFWFRVLYADVGLIAASQGRAVQQRSRPRWQQHVGWVFEEAARGHAIRLAQRGVLPEDMVIGRWWATTGEPCEVDVLGLRAGRTRLMGEARWRDRPLGARDLAELVAKRSRVPRPAADVTFALWGRAGIDRALRRDGVLGFDVGDVLR